MQQLKKKRIPIQSAQPGDILAEPVVQDTRHISLSEGTVLTPSLIDRLKRLDIRSINIQANTLVLSDQIDLTTSEGFAAVYASTVAELKLAFSTMRYFREVPICQMQELAEVRVLPLMEARGVISHLQSVKRIDDYTYYHSINVAIISGVLGKWIGLAGVDLKELVLAGLLHDIGKTQVPLVILNKPGRLTDTEMTEMRRHVIRGYELLAKCGSVSEIVVRGILEHHERLDGSGYPRNLDRQRLHPYSNIIAVADIYDAMTSDRVYQKKRTPFSVVEELSMDMFNKLDPTVCTVFLNNVKDYFIGSVIRLSNGQEAEVVYLGRSSATRPVIRTEDGEFIDLEVNKQLSIEGLA